MQIASQFSHSRILDTQLLSFCFVFSFFLRMAAELRTLKEYVTACDANRYDSLPEGFVKVDVTHSNLVQRWHDVTVFLDCTVLELKMKLFKKNGTLTDSMELFVRNGSLGNTLYMGDDAKTFRYYGGSNGCEIHIRDTDPYSISANGALENVNLVEKYVMPDSVYDTLPNTLRSHIRKQREFDPNFKINLVQPSVYHKAPLSSDHPETPRNATELYFIGNRCEVNPGGRRGEIKFFGSIAGLPGSWIGVELDEPLGQNNGEGPDGVKYFQAKPEYGCFAKHYNVNVGDFPVEDFLASDDEI